MESIAQTPEPPYYAVVFTSPRASDGAGYEEMAEQMAALAAAQPGYLGLESVRDVDGVGITVSYWSSLNAIRAWREHAEHRIAQQLGRSRWYQQFTLRVCRVEESWGFARAD